MQSRRRFFCARVELVQLARAFLCPSSQSRPQRRTAHAGTMDGTAAPGAIPAAYRGQAPGTLYHSRDSPQSRPGYNQPPQGQPRRIPAHSRHRGRTEPRNRARGTGIQASTKTGHRAAHRPENRKPPETAFTAPQSHATPPGVFPYYHSRKSPTEPPTAAHRGKQSTAPAQYRRKCPINAPQSRPGRGCYSYTTRRQNAAQGRTEPPTEGKPPGVQECPERRRPCPGLLYHAKVLIGQPRSGQIFERFSVIFPSSVPLCQ